MGYIKGFTQYTLSLLHVGSSPTILGRSDSLSDSIIADIHSEVWKGYEEHVRGNSSIRRLDVLLYNELPPNSAVSLAIGRFEFFVVMFD